MTKEGVQLQTAPAGFKVKGDHEEEQVIDHCTMDTFDSMQSTEDSVTIVNPGQRFDHVCLTDSMCNTISSHQQHTWKIALLSATFMQAR